MVLLQKLGEQIPKLKNRLNPPKKAGKHIEEDSGDQQNVSKKEAKRNRKAR